MYILRNGNSTVKIDDLTLTVLDHETRRVDTHELPDLPCLLNWMSLLRTLDFVFIIKEVKQTDIDSETSIELRMATKNYV